MDEKETTGLDRRELIKRGAVVGGALVWATPVVQSLATPAFAAGTGCQVDQRTRTDEGVCVQTTYNESQACCDCIERRKNAGEDSFNAAAACKFEDRACKFDRSTAGPSNSC